MLELKLNHISKRGPGVFLGYYGLLRNTYSGGSFEIPIFADSFFIKYVHEKVISARIYSGSLCICANFIGIWMNKVNRIKSRTYSKISWKKPRFIEIYFQVTLVSLLHIRSSTWGLGELITLPYQPFSYNFSYNFNLNIVLYITHAQILITIVLRNIHSWIN